MSSERQQLEAGIAALQAQRAVLGDAIVDSLLAPALARLAALRDSAPGEPEQILRQVSILFLDVVGSTTLSQRLDPEEVSAVMDGALSRGTTIVEAHRGRVLSYAGDNLLGVFGADGAQEDDAERAVRCGLDLLALGRTLGNEVLVAHGHAGFDVRVGIHTGGVLLGGGVDEDGSIRGSAVNIAARMEQTAPSGALRITQDTYTQVRGVFDVVPQDSLRVKGIDAPVTSYLVQRVKPRAFRVQSRGIDGVATRMIGRDAELGVLQEAFKRLFDRGAVFERVTVVAEAGIGKSRLLYEFRNWVESRAERFFLFQARATPQTQGQAYGLLRDLFAWRFEIGDGDAMEVAKQKLEAGLVPLFIADEGEFEAEAHAHLLGHLIGLDYSESVHIRGIRDDGRQIRVRGFNAAAQALRRIAAQGGSPILVYLDDLHWADDASLDFIDYLTGATSDVPMLIVSLARPILFERRAGHSPTRRVDLHSLDSEESRDLADELLKNLVEIPAALHELVTAGADGNPFYMEELVKMLIDQKAIDTSGAHWSVDAKRLSLKVPSTLTGVLQARLDGLPPTERHALQLASVIGQNFWDAALAYVEAGAAAELCGLSRRELVHLKDSIDHGDDVREYAFHHQILHQVTYETVLKRVRRLAHAKTAQWLAEYSGTRAKAALGTAAEHYERADDEARAAEFYARAAEHAASIFANEAVLDYAARALKLAAPEAHALRWRVHEARERTLDLLGRRDAQRIDVDALERLADAVGDDRLRAEAALRHAMLAARTGDLESGRVHAERAIAARTDDEELILRATQPLTFAMAYSGEATAGRAIAEAALARAQALGLPRAHAKLANAAALCAEMQGDVVAGLRFHELASDSSLGDRRGEAVALGNAGIGYLNLGDFATARRYLEKALQLNRLLGNRMAEGAMLSTLSVIARRRGENEEALTHAEAAVAILTEIRTPPQLRNALDALGNAELASGRYVASAAAFDRCEALGREIRQPQFVVEALEAHIRVALARGDGPHATATAERLLAETGVDATGTLGASGDDGDPLAGASRPLIHLTLHRVWSQAGDPRADVALVAAHRSLQADADAITDATLRQSYLHAIAEHRDIEALWAVRARARSLVD